jgi:hypothetical protein
MRRAVAACALALAILAGCGGTTGDEPPAPPAPAGTVDDRCAQLSQEVLDAHNRGDRQAEDAAAAEFDRLAEAGECDR